ncbi:MAG: transglycosylase domain-containing protein [Saprospiraceae bacterium]|nr:transglycosylase domain-containing protein [Saprospiraceae bacterium]
MGAGLALCLSLVAITAFVLLLFNGAFGPIPTSASLKTIDHNLASEVYSADGVLLGRYFFENRLPSSLEEIPACLKNALIAAEDTRFYEHHGIDYWALGRVLVKSILMQEDESGGGSTITQQLAKNLYPRKKFRLMSLPINKAKEMVIAARLEKVYSKEEILTLYLNTIPLQRQRVWDKNRFQPLLQQRTKKPEARAGCRAGRNVESHYSLPSFQKPRTLQGTQERRAWKDGKAWLFEKNRTGFPPKTAPKARLQTPNPQRRGWNPLPGTPAA